MRVSILTLRDERIVFENVDDCWLTYREKFYAIKRGRKTDYFSAMDIQRITVERDGKKNSR